MVAAARRLPRNFHSLAAGGMECMDGVTSQHQNDLLSRIDQPSIDNAQVTELNRAHDLDPASASITQTMGMVYIGSRQYDQAVEVCKKLAKENPTFARAHSCLARISHQK